MSEQTRVERSRPRDNWARAWAIVIALSLFGATANRLFQGLDLQDQGLWLLGTSILAEGDAVHARIETGDGPLRYWLLLPFYLVSGGSAAAWAWLHAFAVAVVAGVGIRVLLRRGAGAAAALWPLGLLAVLPLALPACSVLLALALIRWAVERSQDPLAWAAAGVATGIVAALDPRWAPVPLITAGISVIIGPRPSRRAAVAFVTAGLGVALAILAITGLAGAGAATFHNSWILPLQAISTHFGEGGALRWWVTLDRGFWLREPFAGLLTGERLDPILPGHGVLRAGSLRLMASLAIAMPLACAWRTRGADRALSMAVALGAAWVLLSRGNVPSVQDAFVVALPVGILAAGRVRAAAPRTLLVLLLALAALPLAIETLALVGFEDRDGLQRWDRPRAGVDLAEGRIARLEELATTLGPAALRPVLVWPSWPGLHHVLDLPLTTRWVTLRGTNPDGAKVLAEIRDAQPDAVVLAADRGFPTTRMRALMPDVWQHLRQNYRIAATAVGGEDPFRLLQRLDGTGLDLESVSLRERVPEIELTVANETSPALRRNLEVGQSFTLGERDLEGFAVRWSTRGRDLPITIRVRIWQKLGDTYDALLAASTVQTKIAGDGARSWFRYPTAATAGKDIAITLEAREAPAEEVRLYWHRHDAGDVDVDLFAEGSALLDRQPVEADLFFIVY